MLAGATVMRLTAGTPVTSAKSPHVRRVVSSAPLLQDWEVGASCKSLRGSRAATRGNVPLPATNKSTLPGCVACVAPMVWVTRHEKCLDMEPPDAI